MKQVLIINGHPDKESFNHALSSAYKEGLSKTTATVSQIDIADLSFNPTCPRGYITITCLQNDADLSVGFAIPPVCILRICNPKNKLLVSWLAQVYDL